MCGLAHGEQTRCCVQDGASQAECHAAPSSDYQRVQDLEHATGDHGGANDSRIGYGDCDRIDPGNNRVRTALRPRRRTNATARRRRS